jgi:hypothetical protein
VTWVRHHAWLTIPPRADKDGPPKQARGISLAEDAPQRAYPPIEDSGGVLEWLEDAGWCAWGDYGATGLAWAELEAWARLTGAQPEPWQARLMFALSQHFGIAANEARDPACKPPFDPAADLLDPAQVERQRSAVLRAFGGGRGDG